MIYDMEGLKNSYITWEPNEMKDVLPIFLLVYFEKGLTILNICVRRAFKWFIE